MPGTILIATDFSRASQLAVDAGAALARDEDARVILLHCAPSIRKGAKKAARPDELTELAERLRAEGIDVEPRVVEGDAAAAIVQEADAANAAIIVMGTAGRTGLKGWALGSVARDVLRHTRTPVLIAPARMNTSASKAASKTILVCTDFSDDSDQAYAAGLAVARDTHAKVRLLHVVDIPFTTAAVPYTTAMLTPEMLAKDEESALQGLAQMATSARKHKVAVEPAVQVGHVSSAILAEARSCKAFLIVVATHGKSGLRNFLLGSIAQAVVQMADRPVLVVPTLPDRGAWLR